MKKRTPLLYKIVGFLAIVVIICLVLLIPPVSDAAGKVVGWTGAKLRMVAETVAGIAVGAIIAIVGVIAAGAGLPILGGILLIAGLGTLVWNVVPLFNSSPSTNGKV